MEILNALETPQDYSLNEEANCFVLNQTTDSTENVIDPESSHLVREKIAITEIVNHVEKGVVKLPLKYISTFFRTLKAPIINNKFEFEITYRPFEAIRKIENTLRTPLPIKITDTVLYLPVIDLPTDYKAEMVSSLNTELTKYITWEKIEKVTKSVTVNELFEDEIFASINGIQKLIVFARNEMEIADAQHLYESTSQISLTNAIIVIDSNDFFQKDISEELDHYTLLQELFQGQGHDLVGGSVLSYSNFRKVNRYYGYDLSRQSALEFEPKKPQSIGFRGTFDATCPVQFFAFKKVTLKVDMKNPFNTILF